MKQIISISTILVTVLASCLNLGESGIVEADISYDTTPLTSLALFTLCPDPKQSYQSCTKQSTSYSYGLRLDKPQAVISTQKIWICGNVEVSFDAYKAKVAAGVKSCYESSRTVTVGMQYICTWSRYESLYNITSYYTYGKLDHSSANLYSYKLLTGQDIMRSLTSSCPSKP